MSDIINLNKRRGQLKGSITRFLSIVNTENPDLINIRLRREKLEEIWSEYQQVQSEIDIEENVDEEEQNKYREEFEDLYFEAQSKAVKLLEHPIESPIRKYSDTLPMSRPNLISNCTPHPRINLPQITIPTFTGDHKQWPVFFDLFLSLIHNNNDLAEIQKFFYLRSVLAGEALLSIHCLETTANNYQTAWNILVKRYSNKRIMVSKHVKALFELESLTSESAVRLKSLADEVLGHMRALESLGQEPERWGPLFIHLICSKLDKNTLQEWESISHSEETAEVSHLIDFVERRYKVLEAVESARSIHNRTKSVQPHFIAKRNYQKSTLVTSASTLNCYCCNEQHTIYRCPKLLSLSISERIKKISDLNLCKICLLLHPNKKMLCTPMRSMKKWCNY
ncbi:uncharacterized protein LOC126910474 [Daktulosphaira vitifoliae]|uniref:uncharacterized protein LOC126910474 n=1 Tax=Daktulosphaira vitifoliae TaxID=58002 RepID=UPI0021AA8F16|nr:uncharacterized protein LOC126910474 [Daktulosphaira vitifoliae]